MGSRLSSFWIFLYLGTVGIPSSHALFVKSQMERINPEPLFDSEYFLDLLSFSYPEEWLSSWRASSAAYRINGASLDCCDLYLQQELKFSRPLLDDLGFHYRLTQLEDKDRQELHQWLELKKSFTQGLSLGLFGEPTFRKEDSDIGLALGYQVTSLAVINLRHTWVDFNFNKRGSTTQRYKKKPSTEELSLLLARGAHRLAAYLEFDSPLERSVPDEGRSYSYRRTALNLEWHHSPPETWSKAVEYRYEFQKERNFFDPDPLQASQDFQRHTHRLGASLSFSQGSRNSFEVGHILMMRRARSRNPLSSDQKILYRRWESQPYLRWHRTIPPWMVTELAGFLSTGENRGRRLNSASPSFHETLFEVKLGTGVDFRFFSKSSISFYGTWDLDNPKHPWDGGNVRAQFSF